MTASSDEGAANKNDDVVDASDARRPRRRRRTAAKKLEGAASDCADDGATSFACGLVAGVSQAGLFNPVDRALYLSVRNRVPFLSRENFVAPYSGFWQSVGHRALSGGLYFPLERFFLERLALDDDDDDDRATSRHLFAGTAAGTTNALLVNPVAAVKYKAWGRETNRGWLREASDMLRRGGVRPFLNGASPTVLRDAAFGATYTVSRLGLARRFADDHDGRKTTTTMIVDFAAASAATVVSGPFNLARNVQYGTPSRRLADGVLRVLADLRREVGERATIAGKLSHLQQRLRIGWGTVRVGAGMSFGHRVYDVLYETYG